MCSKALTAITPNIQYIIYRCLTIPPIPPNEPKLILLAERRKEPGRIPFARLRRAKALVHKPLHRFVQMRTHAGQPVALVRVHLMAEGDALRDERTRQHQRVLLVDQRVGGAVHQEVLAIGQIAGAHRQIGVLHLERCEGVARRLAVRIAVDGGHAVVVVDVRRGGHEAIGEEGTWKGSGLEENVGFYGNLWFRK